MASVKVISQNYLLDRAESPHVPPLKTFLYKIQLNLQ